MEPIEPCEELFFLSYKKFKVKFIAILSLQNMTKPTFLYETVIEPKDVLQDQHNIENQDNPTSHKIPRDNQVNLATPP
jgi:hypothetical protein